MSSALLAPLYLTAASTGLLLGSVAQRLAGFGLLVVLVVRFATRLQRARGRPPQPWATPIAPRRPASSSSAAAASSVRSKRPST